MKIETTIVHPIVNFECTGNNYNVEVASEVVESSITITPQSQCEVTKDWQYFIFNTTYSGVITTLESGTIRAYNYKDNTIIYRYITTDKTGLYPTEDSFYSTFDGTTLSDLITTR